MKKIAILLGVLLCIPLAHAQPPDGPGMGENPQEAPIVNPGPLLDLGPARAAINRLNNPAEEVDLSSPEATVRSFLWAFNNQDLDKARLCVDKGELAGKLAPLQQLLSEQLSKVVLLARDVHAYRVGDNATVTLWLDFVMTAKLPNTIGTSERFRLSRINNQWLIQPKHDAKQSLAAAWGTIPEDMLDRFAAKMTNAQYLQEEFANETCQSQLLQIGRAFFQYAQDFDENFPPLENWQKEILPYIKDEKVFKCPLAGPEETSYSYNPELNGVQLAAFAAPAQTILLYEGKDQKFEFRHEVNGVKLTNILFADGHVKAYSREALDAAMKDGMMPWKPAP